MHRSPVAVPEFGTGEIGTGVGLVVSDTNWSSQVHCRGYLDSKTGKCIFYDRSTFFIVAVLMLNFTFLHLLVGFGFYCIVR